MMVSPCSPSPWALRVYLNQRSGQHSGMIVALLPLTLGFEGSTLTRGLANIQV
jgi:hypothetical protein